MYVYMYMDTHTHIHKRLVAYLLGHDLNVCNICVQRMWSCMCIEKKWYVICVQRMCSNVCIENVVCVCVQRM